MTPHPSPETLPNGFKKGDEVSSPALVLRVRPYRESDLMVHVLTPTFGKIALLARGARGSRKRFPNSLDIFDRGSARLVREKTGLFGIKEFTGSHSLIQLREDLDKLTLASLVCESYDSVLQENDLETGPQLFEVLDLSLNAINESLELRGALRASFIALASLCTEAGIADMSSASPGSRSLDYMLDSIERFTEKPLASRTALRGVLKKIA